MRDHCANNEPIRRDDTCCWTASVIVIATTGGPSSAQFMLASRCAVPRICAAQIRWDRLDLAVYSMLKFKVRSFYT
jgi:hypothetical protein